MGGSSKSVTVGHKYYVGGHVAIMAGSADKVFRIDVSDYTAWAGDGTGQILIDKPDLFGGKSAEGGIVGTVDIERGLPDQDVNDYLAAKLDGGLVPAFRGFTCAVLRQVYIGLNYYMKDWTWWCQRIFTGEDGALQWYPEKAMVGDVWTVEVFDEFMGTQSGWVSSTAGTWAYSRNNDAYYEVEDAVSGFSRLSSIGAATLAAGPFGSYAGVHTPVGTAVDRSIRIAFPVLIPPGEHEMSISVYHDDGAVVWVDNGQVAAFSGATGFALAPSTATVTISGGPHTIYCTVVDTRNPNWSKTGSATNILLGVDLSLRYGTGGTYAEGVEGGSLLVGTYGHMNPAHMIREWYTHSFGHGYPSAIMGTSFTTAADTLYDEGFGLSMRWQSYDADDNIAEICRHIDAVTYQDPETGLFEIKLIRDDYDVADLLVLDESNVLEVLESTQQTLFDCINEVTVTYEDGDTGEQATFTGSDIALIEAMGGAVPKESSYPGIATADVAEMVTWRDLRSGSTPRLSRQLKCTREAAVLRKGDVFVHSWAVDGIAEMVMRVTEVNYGSTTSSAVTVTCTQDVFSTPTVLAMGSGSSASAWVPENTAPVACDTRIAIELPYLELVQQQGQVTVDAELVRVPESGWIGVTAATPTASTINARLYTDSGAGYVEHGVVEVCPVATLAAGVSFMDTDWTITAVADMDLVETWTWAQVDDELVAVSAIDIDAGTMTVQRCVMDSVPATHASGATIFFWDVFAGSDNIEYVTSDEVDIKLCPITAGGVLSIDDAPVDTVTIAGRAARPYPPANVQIAGEYWPESVTGSDVVLTYSHRDRTQQTASTFVGWTDGNIGPETGVTYSATLTRVDTSEELDAVAEVTDGTLTLTQSVYAGDVRVDLWAVRDGLDSFRTYSHTFDHIVLVANDDIVETDDATEVTGNVLDNDGGDNLYVVDVGGLAVNVGVAQTLTNGSVITINSDGSYTIDPTGCDTSGGDVVDTIEYTVSNGEAESSAWLTVTVSPSTSSIPTDGLVAFYTGDNVLGTTLVDEIGTYPGTLVGTFTQPAGVVGNAIYGASTSTYVTIGNLGTWLKGRTEFTISMWIKPDTYTGGGPQFCVSYSSHTSPHYLAFILFTSTRQLFACTSNSHRQEFTNTLSTSEYYHVVMSYADSSFDVWVNGVQWVDAHACASSMPAAATATAMLGRIPAFNTTANTQRICQDQIRIYNRALSAVEVAALYHEVA